MSVFSYVECTLNVNMQCHACIMKVFEVLSASVVGRPQYHFDPEEGLAIISGNMDPNIVMKAISRNPKHATVKWLDFDRTSSPYSYSNNGHQNQVPYGYWPAQGAMRHNMPPQSYNFVNTRPGWEFPNVYGGSYNGYGGNYYGGC